MRRLPPGIGLILTLTGCGPTRPTVPPVPAPLIGSCYRLHYSPTPPPLGDWTPSDTARFLSTRYTQSIDTGQETNGHLARSPAPPDQPRQADWWVTKGTIHLAFRALAAVRLLEFDSLTPPGLGRWRQTDHPRALTGVVRAEPVTCGGVPPAP